MEQKPTAETSENRKVLTVFSIASFLNDFGSDMIYPIWPLFVEALLIAQPNMVPTILGFIDGLGDAIVSVSQAISGYVSDRVGKRKIFIWTGYLCGATSRLGYAVSSFWAHLVPFRILDRAGKMRGAPRDAIIADASTRENRGRNFGLLRTMDNLGAVFGIITCILLFSYLGYQALFILAAIPSLIGSLLVLIFIKDRKTGKIFHGISFKDMTPNLKLFLFISAVFALGAFSYSFLLIYAQNFGFQAAFIPVLYLIFTVVASIASLPFGKLADMVGRKTVLILSYFFWGALCLGFILNQSYIGIILLFVLYGLHKGAIEPVQRAFVSELCPEKLRASFLGAFQMVVGLCAMPASLIAGVFWTSFGKHAPFYFSFALALVAVGLMVFLKEQK
ncbi:MAG: MFS transporter [Candidatus Bathyarchaeia archaeon]|jgi:MFS family permease|nr:MFS transporter [Candidatus Bathyarchaeota archaeon A05DMB-4]MDH7595576.1 MFS transporter [Candidatus Bathyarchaeota archaeon]